MILLRGASNFLSAFANGTVTTIGNFDGVHLGHQALLQKAELKAKAEGLPLVVLLFEPQPNEFFQGDKAPARLSSLSEKLAVFSQFAIDYVCCLRFNQKLAEMSASEFAEKTLFTSLNTKHLLLGADFRFGHKRLGDVALLQNLAVSHGARLEIFPDFIKDDKRISSTKIREALALGHLGLAEKMLGRPYSLCGRVVRGDGRGRELLGIPTANLHIKRAAMPLKGVFSVQVRIFSEQEADKKEHSGVANLGCRPTLDGQKNILEVHLFDYNSNLYGKTLQVFFLQKLRDEVKFQSISALIEQIHADIAKAKQALT